MLEWAIIPIGALFNRLRGWDSKNEQIEKFTSKFIIAAAWGVMLGIYSMDSMIGLIVAAGFSLWSPFGWGDYFDFSTRSNNEVKLIDYLVSLIFKPGATCDIVSMSLRGLIIYPLFIGLYLYTGSFVALQLGLLSIGQGIIYYTWHLIDHDDLRGIKTIGAELSTGGLFAALIMGAL